MISLSTGLPGAGKTLYTIAFVKELAEREHRPVFYSGIKDLALDWHEIEAEKWFECPEGAIIVIDECQRIFRPRGSGAKVPEYVSRLETHRHAGHDVFLVTQHPMLMDSNVRRLTERHWHISRRFGMQRSTIFQFESCKEQPLAQTANAQRIDWKYPKEVFGYYKSAEVHTVKRRLPIQYAVIVIVPVICIALLWYFITRHYKDGELVVPGMENMPKQSVKTDQPSTPGQRPAEKPKSMTQAEYLAAYRPRVEGLAYTAPIYDEVTKPVRAPVPMGAIISKKGCKAYTDQGTPLDMPDSICRQIASKGFYREFDNKPLEERRIEQNRPQASDRATQAADLLNAPQLPSVVNPSPGNDSTNPKFNVAMRGR